MAITKIHPIKHTLGKSITYIGNGNKTENGKYISTFGCAYETAELEFELTAQSAKGGGKNQAYHLIQSFKPNEVTPKQCHEIEKNSPTRFWAGNMNMCFVRIQTRTIITITSYLTPSASRITSATNTYYLQLFHDACDTGDWVKALLFVRDVRCHV